jgi:hypothetical protein
VSAERLIENRKRGVDKVRRKELLVDPTRKPGFFEETCQVSDVTESPVRASFES